jgi:CheY-like chemotaxis protein
VLSDVMMPRRNGQELLRDLRSEPRTKNIPVVLVTAKAELESKLMGLQEGAGAVSVESLQLLTSRGQNLAAPAPAPAAVWVEP